MLLAPSRRLPVAQSMDLFAKSMNKEGNPAQYHLNYRTIACLSTGFSLYRVGFYQSEVSFYQFGVCNAMFLAIGCDSILLNGVCFAIKNWGVFCGNKPGCVSRL